MTKTRKKGFSVPLKVLVCLTVCLSGKGRKVPKYISVPGLILRKSGTKLIYILCSRAKKEIYLMNIFNGKKKKFLVLNVI